jgi:general secretion pathway protein L
MAHKILGVELGAFSVKMVVATAGFRQSVVTDFVEQAIPPGDEPHDERAAKVLGQLIRERGLEHDLPYVALAGDALSLRYLEFPFAGLKRADLHKAVGAELEAQLPHDLEDIVYDFEPLHREDLDSEAPSAEPGATPGTRILAVAALREKARRLLTLLGQAGAEPRGLVAAPTALARAVLHLSALEANPQAPCLVVDLGHARTDLCLVKNGHALDARTLSRGGRHITQAIANAWNLSMEDAERAKEQDGFIASASQPPPSAAWERISVVVERELQPLVRDLRQTLTACRAKLGVQAERILLCGGGARLRGLGAYLSEKLELPVVGVSEEDAQRLLGAAADRIPADSALLAYGVALEGATGRPRFDLRQGELAYRADFSFLRAKAAYLGASALLVVAFAAASAYASLYQLRKEEGILEEKHRAATMEVFGEEVAIGEVQDRIAPKKEESPLPKATAFDQLVELSKKIPPRDKLKVDVLELDIKPQKISIKATTDSAASIDELEKGLKTVDCFGDIQRGKVQSPGAGEEKQFTLTIATKCM